MKKLAKLAATLMALSFLMGTVACGGADKGANDATDAAEPADGGEKKGLEKFEGNKMEVADEEEGADEGGEEGGEE